MSLRNLGLALSIALGSLVAAGVALAESAGVAYEIDAKDCPVTFLAVGKPGFLRIRGEGARLRGRAEIKDGAVSGTFRVTLADLTTGIGLRDEHMKEKYLEVGKFPEAVLTLDPTPFVGSVAEGGSFKGNLTIKGKTLPVAGTFGATEDAAAGTVRGSAKLKISLTEFEVGIPSYLGVKVAEDVEIETSFVGTRAPGATH